jgi:predicted DNA-binding ribbon-helix-helix protein
MGVSISVRLDDDVYQELRRQAQSRGIGLAALLRELATQAAREGDVPVSAAVAKRWAAMSRTRPRHAPSMKAGARPTPMPAEEVLTLQGSQIALAVGVEV